MIADKKVLITGGAGSVGRALVSHLLPRDPEVIRIFDNNEPNLAEFKNEIDDDSLRFLAGDIRDKDRLDRAVQDIDIVVHAAAMKHVDIAEYNPFEAVKTNVVGLQSVVDAAIDADVDRLVFTSSDKAVNPANTMGTTKLLGEKLVTAGNKYSGQSDLQLSSVRFGNVINSSQSVIPLFHRQIRDGGPLTLTDERMTRFFLTYDDIADLLIQAITEMESGEVFVYKMSAIRILDLATAMRETLASSYGHDPSDIEIEQIGPRLGETMHEEIMTDREAGRSVENDDLYAILPETTETNGYLDHPGFDGFDDPETIVQSSADATKLDRSEITALLRNNVVPEVRA